MGYSLRADPKLIIISSSNNPHTYPQNLWILAAAMKLLSNALTTRL